MYEEDEYITIGEISHFIFCPRQWALIYLEQEWKENIHTLEGHEIHERAHDPMLKERRNDTIIARALPVFSRELGLSGECDVVEFKVSAKGVYIPAYKGTYEVFPIEYKRGVYQEDAGDIWQLVGQAMCLSEMLMTPVHTGYIYYSGSRRRMKVAISEEWKEQVRNAVREMRQYLRRGYTPKVKRHKGCRYCSIQNQCLPTLRRVPSVQAYLAERREE